MLLSMVPDIPVERVVRTLYDGGILVVEGQNYSFGHALLREAIVKDLLPFELEGLHHKAAEALEADPRRGSSVSDLVALALHWGQANDPDMSLAAAA